VSGDLKQTGEIGVLSHWISTDCRPTMPVERLRVVDESIFPESPASSSPRDLPDQREGRGVDLPRIPGFFIATRST